MPTIKKNKNYYAGDRIDMLPYISNDAKIILDIGCGQGNFALQLLKPEREVWGIEPDAASAQIASEKLHRVFNKKIEDCIAEIPDNYFDAIIFNDVLEHMIDPWDVLSIMGVKLSSNGKIIASIPNFRYITNLFHILVKKDLIYEDAGILDSTHLRFFTKESIKRMFEQNKYVIQTIKGISKTSSFKGLMLSSLINLLTLGSHRDIYFKQFVVIAKRA